jgi:hypothetical protein
VGGCRAGQMRWSLVSGIVRGGVSGGVVWGVGHVVGGVNCDWCYVMLHVRHPGSNGYVGFLALRLGRSRRGEWHVGGDWRGVGGVCFGWWCLCGLWYVVRSVAILVGVGAEGGVHRGGGWEGELVWGRRQVGGEEWGGRGGGWGNGWV